MKRPWIIAASACLLATVTSAAEPAAKPTPTPTPRKLSGGFGRGADAVVTPPGAPAPPATGQSLADAVRAASAGKKKEAKGRIAITNQTLVTDPRKGKLTTASPRPPAPTPAAVREEVTPTPAPAEEAEAYWRDRMHTAKSRVEDLQDRVRRFEQESKKLENDFYSWDDGQYRDGVIKPAWDRKREELETARRDLQQAEKDLADLPEKARKAGALPGWLRE
jgi:hypothetical protein